MYAVKPKHVMFSNKCRHCIYFIYLFIRLYDRGSLFRIFTTLIYHKVLSNNKTEQDTEQDKHTKILVEQFTYIVLCSVYQY